MTIEHCVYEHEVWGRISWKPGKSAVILYYVQQEAKLKNITLSPFRKLVRPVVPSDIPGDQYFEYVTANSIFILFLQISLTRVVIK